VNGQDLGETAQGKLQEDLRKLGSIEEYNTAIKKQDTLIDTMHKYQWDNASTHTKAEAKAAKQLQDNAKKYKENLEVGRADIMGFGAGGYWSQNGKTYGQKNPADAHAYARGTGGVSDYDTGMKHALGVGKPNPADAHAYARGTGGVSDYTIGMKHALGVGKSNPADAHKYARGAGGVGDYDKGMAHI